jgi:archaetidylinositol phosphate synthase
MGERSRQSPQEEVGMDQNRAFGEAKREINGLLGRHEKPLLVYLASRLPPWVGSDHLTLLGLFATALAGGAYLAVRWQPHMLHLVNLALVLNWFGDSLDGTLARQRNHCRPRYGFYVDHVIDAFGALFVLGGLALSGLMSPAAVGVFLIAYYLMAINVYLTTYTLGVFRISYGPIGGTELRVLLMLCNLVVLYMPRLTILGWSVLVFDAVATAVAAALFVTGVHLAIRNTIKLYRLEPLPRLSYVDSLTLMHDSVTNKMAVRPSFARRSDLPESLKA